MLTIGVVKRPTDKKKCFNYQKIMTKWLCPT
jgi:hypothetical protein